MVFDGNSGPNKNVFIYIKILIFFLIFYKLYTRDISMIYYYIWIKYTNMTIGVGNYCKLTLLRHYSKTKHDIFIICVGTPVELIFISLICFKY